MTTDRYAKLDAHADCGLGAEELHTRRYTRPVERITLKNHAPQDFYLDQRVRLQMVTHAADLLHDVVLETPPTAQHRERLRDLSQAVKNLADSFGAEMKMPATP